MMVWRNEMMNGIVPFKNLNRQNDDMKRCSADNQMKSRAWCFTLNNYTEEEAKEVSLWHPSKATWLIVGYEIGEENKVPHLQGCVKWKSQRTLSACRKEISGRCHWEIKKGTYEQNVEYCSKGGDWKEYGDRPLDPKEKGAKEKRKWDEVALLARAGKMDEICELHPDIYVRSYATLKKIRKDNQELPECLEGNCGYWIYGPPGTGKSHYALERWPDLYRKGTNKWFQSYTGQETVLMEEIEKDASYMGHFLKLWMDKTPFAAEDKHGGLLIRPKRVVVTSNYSIEEVFEDEMVAAAIRRRCKVIHLTIVHPDANLHVEDLE